MSCLTNGSYWLHCTQSEPQFGDKSEVKAGSNIIIFGAVKKDDGMLEANRINVGRDGITPPM